MSLLAAWLLEAAGLALPDGPLTVALTADDVAATTSGPGRWSLTGVARRIPYGRVAGHVVVLATGSNGPVVAVLPPAADALILGTNLAGDPLDDLALDGLPVAAAAPVDDGMAELYDLRVALSRLLLGAGAAETVQALTVRHVSDRVQFGRSLAKFQAVQQLVAELAGEVAALQIGADAALRASLPCRALWLLACRRCV